MDFFEHISQHMKLKGYSRHTVKNYILSLKKLSKETKKPIKYLKPSDLKTFVSKEMDKGRAGQTINQYIAAYKFVIEEIFKQNVKIDFSYKKRERRNPSVLSKKEIEKIIAAETNPAYRVIYQIIYGSGLRVGEAVVLKVGDVDLDESIINVRMGKGKKDRISVLSPAVVDAIKFLSTGKGTGDFLFPSNRGGHLTPASVQKQFKRALGKSGVKKPATCHVLRHSFATHLLEGGTDTQYIQKLLGHANIRTTQIYARVTKNALKNIKSPL